MIIEIWTKKKYSKNEEMDLITRLSHARLRPDFAKISRLYRIDADFEKKDFEKIAKEILIDPITEEYSLSDRIGKRRENLDCKLKNKNLFRVEVWLKDSVTDVIGESVQETILDVIHKKVKNVRYGHAYYLFVDSGSRIKHAVSEVLINELIHVCRINKI
jgi:phosphoribosylformylglycinamidine (FGAM) synthase PurS component